VFDDLGQAKHAPDEFRRFNADTVLLLDGRRARRWINGGDRPAPIDLFNHYGGSLASLRLLIAHVDSRFAGGALYWALARPDGSVVAEDTLSVPSDLAPSRAHEAAQIDIALPHVERAEPWRLSADLNGFFRNEWTLWIYPEPGAWDGVTTYDPLGAFGGIFPHTHFSRDDVVIASVWTPALEDFVRDGGRALLIQTGGGAFPTRPVPFWREAIKLLYDHGVWDGFPHQGYADLQFYHLATDHALDLSGFDSASVQPILRRLDARVFTVLDYAAEIRFGAGRLIATSLRFWGGAGDQVVGLAASPAAAFLLRRMVEYLQE
jgi:hypothetical protein